MSNGLSVGDVLEGKVTAIKKYGAFVQLSAGVSGLVHISQIASEYVKQVEDYLEVGDAVNVKVIELTNGRVSLSIKQVSALSRKDGGNQTTTTSNRKEGTSKFQGQRMSKPPSEKEKMNSLEEKLKKWMKSSEERIHELQSKQKRK